MKKILIIEDDRQIAELERDYLEMSHYQADIAGSGPQGLDMALRGGYSLIILDVMLPVMDGMEVCRRISQASDVPILLVTAKAGNTDKVIGLQLGAADYIVKPFEPSELVARVNAHISRYERLVSGQAERDGPLFAGRLRLEKKARRVFLDDEELSLPNKEFDLLAFMMANPNTVFSKNELLDNIWGVDFLGDVSTVAVHINRLRDKIETDSARPEYIETVWGTGYRFKV